MISTCTSRNVVLHKVIFTMLWRGSPQFFTNELLWLFAQVYHSMVYDDGLNNFHNLKHYIMMTVRAIEDQFCQVWSNTELYCGNILVPVSSTSVSINASQS